MSARERLRAVAETSISDPVWADRAWAAILLALDPATCASILAGRSVRAGNLDGFFLRRALRGGRLPDAEAYIAVTAAMLDAIVEAGPVKDGGAR